MGCCGSLLRELVHAEKPARPPRPAPQRPSFSLSAQQAAPPPPACRKEEVPTLAEFSLAELRAVTDGFVAGNIVSESGKKAPNLVYRGRLKGGGAAPRCSITVKKFSKLAWPDPKQFEVRRRGEHTPSAVRFPFLGSRPPALGCSPIASCFSVRNLLHV
jgi:BR-signaling kinase